MLLLKVFLPLPLLWRLPRKLEKKRREGCRRQSRTQAPVDAFTVMMTRGAWSTALAVAASRKAPYDLYFLVVVPRSKALWAAADVALAAAALLQVHVTRPSSARRHRDRRWWWRRLGDRSLCRGGRSHRRSQEACPTTVHLPLLRTLRLCGMYLLLLAPIGGSCRFRCPHRTRSEGFLCWQKRWLTVNQTRPLPYHQHRQRCLPDCSWNLVA